MPVDAVVLESADAARLRGSRFAEVLQLARTTSTNLVAAERARAGSREGLVVVADHQNAGRGRLDRTWEAPPGSSLLLSVLFRPRPADLAPVQRHMAVWAVSLAAVEAARVVAGLELWLKWPNDVVAMDAGAVAKVAGVLAEAGTGWMVVGVGLNVSWSPPALPATSLEALAGRRVPRSQLLVELLLALDRLYGQWPEVSRLYRARCATLGRVVNVQRPGRELLVGTAVDLGEHGELVVDPGQGGREEVVYGDVTHATLGPPGSLPTR